MRRIVFILIVGLLFSCSTKELERSLTNVDTWNFVESKAISGTSIYVQEITEISFRNNTFRTVALSSLDTIFDQTYDFSWECKYPNIVRYHLDNEEFYSELELVEHSFFKLRIKGLLPMMKISEFTPMQQ